MAYQFYFDLDFTNVPAHPWAFKGMFAFEVPEKVGYAITNPDYWDDLLFHGKRLYGWASIDPERTLKDIVEEMTGCKDRIEGIVITIELTRNANFRYNAIVCYKLKN